MRPVWIDLSSGHPLDGQYEGNWMSTHLSRSLHLGNISRRNQRRRRFAFTYMERQFCFIIDVNLHRLKRQSTITMRKRWRTSDAYILHEFFTDGSDFLAQCCAEHENLFLMRRHFEYLLNITAHIYEDIQSKDRDTHSASCARGNLPSDSRTLSHSSMMKCFTWRRFNALLLPNARIRPGVPTTMCGQLFLRISSSCLVGRPPKNTATLTAVMCLQKRSYSRLIWKANSRVWQRTMTET